MFEATLYTAELDRSRLQRLTFAAAIAIAATTAGIASMWTLDQLHIDRISGPSQQLELAQFSILPPPPPVVPPPPPPGDGDGDIEDQKVSDPAPTSKREQPESLDADDSPSKIPTRPTNIAAPPSQGIPGVGQSGCPGGVCQGMGKTGPGGKPPCAPPLCSYSNSSAPPIPSGPPKEVEFSALRCLACADPDRAALRKTTASAQGRAGKVSARFCVDAGGRVEAKSITISRSYGDAAVDRIVRSTIEGWRFSPMKVGNQARRACSSVSFNIRFD